MSFRRALVITIALQSANLVLAVLFVLLVSRWLGPSGKGVQSLLVSFGQLTAVVLGFGFAGALPGLVAAQRERVPSALRTQLEMLLYAVPMLAGSLLLNTVWTFAPSIRGYEWVIALFIMLSIVQPFLATLALTVGRAWTSNISTALSSATSLLVLFALKAGNLVTPSTAVLAQALGLVAGSAVVLLAMGSMSRASVSSETRGIKLSEYRRIAILGTLSTAFALAMFRGDMFLVAYLAGGAADVGIYSVAIFSGEMALRVPQWAANVLSPSVAAERNTGVDRTIRLFWMSIAVSVCAYIAAIALAHPLRLLLGVVAGAEFERAYPVILAIFPRIILQSGTAILAGNLAGKGYTFWHPYACFLGMVGVLGLDCVLIPRYGLIGAAGASSLGFVATLVAMFVGFLRQNDLDARMFFARSGELLPRRISARA